MINLAESSLSEVAIGRISVQPVHSMGKQEISDKVVNNKCLDLQIANFPAFTRMGFNRDLLQENPFPEIHLGEDLIFLLNNELPLKKISISDQVVYCYRVGDPNQATKKYRDQNNIVDLLSRIEMILRTCSPKARRMNLAFADKLLLSLVRRGAQEKLSNEAFRIICKVTIHNLISPRLAIKIIFYFCSNRPRVIRALNGK
jgi:hypothetical protein